MNVATTPAKSLTHCRVAGSAPATLLCKSKCMPLGRPLPVAFSLLGIAVVVHAAASDCTVRIGNGSSLAIHVLQTVLRVADTLLLNPLDRTV